MQLPTPFTRKINRLPRKRKKKMKKFLAFSDAIVAQTDLDDFGGFIEDIFYWDEMTGRMHARS